MGDDSTINGTQIPIRRTAGVDPSWTAPVEDQPAVSAVSAPAPDVPPVGPLPGPAPLAAPTQVPAPILAQPETQPAAVSGQEQQSISAQSAVSAPAAPAVDAGQTIPVTNQALVQPAAGQAAPAEAPGDLSLPDDEQKPSRLPIILAIVGGLLLIGIVLLVLWWLGFIFGPPRDPSVAAVQSFTAFQAANGYHIEGSGTIELDPGDTALGSGAFQLTRPGTVALIIRGDRVADAAVTTMTIDLSESSLTLPSLIPNSLDLTIARTQNQVLLQLPILSLLAGAQSDEWLSLTDISADQAAAALDTSNVPAGKRLGFEKLATVQTAHYTYSLTRDQLFALLPMLKALPAGAAIGPEAKIQAELWMGTKDSLPYQLKLAIHEQRAGAKLTSQWLFSLSKFGQADQLALPDTSKSRTASLASIIPDNLTNLEIASRDVQRKADLAKLKTALENYKVQHGGYPSTGNELTKVSDPKSNLAQLVGPYLPSLPVDPNGGEAWYGYRSDGQTYELSAVLESSHDPSGVDRGGKLLFLLTQAGSVHTPATSNESLGSANQPAADATAGAGGPGRLPGN